MPTASYHPSGPIGDVVFTLVPDGRFKHVVVIGLGAGALAAYAGKDARMDFFEVDEAVIQIAENPRYFTYLPDARARPGVNVRTTAVDGRLGLRAMPGDSYDLIVIDAFSSDAIPTHLITREAVALYESRLKSRGLIAFHVSSRFFDLPPVLATIAADRGLVGYVRHDDQIPPERVAEGMRASVGCPGARRRRPRPARRFGPTMGAARSRRRRSAVDRRLHQRAGHSLPVVRGPVVRTPVVRTPGPRIPEPGWAFCSYERIGLSGAQPGGASFSEVVD